MVVALTVTIATNGFLIGFAPYTHKEQLHA